MAFLRSTPEPDESPIIIGVGVKLRTPQMSDFAEWSELRARSRDFLAPWEPTWPVDDLTRTAFRRRIKRYLRDIAEGQAYPFFIYRESDGALVGGLTLSNIRRGVTQSSSLGYWMGVPYAGKGYMASAVRAVAGYVFDGLDLHRLEAACLPDNAASVRLLQRVGFQHEGLARRYLCINGAWRDHLLFALLKDDLKPASGVERRA
ncbi:MAG: GNAT family protein [Pseudomonadota bacterium]